MSAYWFLVAFATYSIVKVSCGNASVAQDEKRNDGYSPVPESIFGFRPCLDETCEDYRPSDAEPKDSILEDGNVEFPRAHCMLLRPSAVNLFGDIEGMYPGISDIKYRLLEEMIEYMHQFSSLKLKNCHPNMQLIDLVILAANSLKTQYILQGEPECIYESYEDNTGKPHPNGKSTKFPCDSGYATGTPCTETTMKPPMGTESTEKPYEHGSTRSTIAEEQYVPTSTHSFSTEDWYVPKTPAQPTVEPSNKPYPDGVTKKSYEETTGTVTEEHSNHEEIEIIAEDEEFEAIIPHVGSLRGIPGVHYPNYTDIPITSFTCADKKYVPGFYADLDTGCQVFHVCYEHRRESFLCPVGTIFNQPILACDYWYSSNCSLASHYYDVNEKTELKEEKIDAEVEEILTLIEDTEKTEDSEKSVEEDLDKIAHFFPVKAVVTETKPEIVIPIETTTSHTEEIASEIVDKMATTATKVISSARDVIKSIPEPVIVKPVFEPVSKPVVVKPVFKLAPKPIVIESDFLPTFKKPMKTTDLLKEAVVPLVKAKLAAIPISKATAFKTAVPVAAFTKAKIPAVKTAAVPVLAKAKIAAAVPVIAKAKVAIPAVKAAAAVPVVAKAKIAATVPVVKAAAVPVVAKAKIAATVPVVKAAAVPVVAKAKIAATVPVVKTAAAVPVIAKTKIAAAAIPAAKVAVGAPVVAAKAKKAAIAVPAAKAAVDASILAKGKIAVPAFKVAASKVAAKSSVPVLKAKMFASAVPLAKTKVVPLMKAKVLKSAGTPLLKAKMLALPLAKSKLAGPLPIAKVKLAKAAAISPLTKKALALGYMKLLKAKKVALMG